MFAAADANRGAREHTREGKGGRRYRGQFFSASSRTAFCPHGQTSESHSRHIRAANLLISMATSSRYEPNCAKGARLHAAPAAPRRVLLVEDHEDTRFMLKTALEMRGLSVTEADNGEAALFLAGAEHPDLIFMDGCLSRLDCIAVT